MGDPPRYCLEGLKENGEPGLLKIGDYPVMSCLQSTIKNRLMSAETYGWCPPIEQVSLAHFWGITSPIKHDYFTKLPNSKKQMLNHLDVQKGIPYIH